MEPDGAVDRAPSAPTGGGARHAESARFRLISLAEFVLGAGVVLGHNVWRVVPNEVPILVLAGFLSIRLRRAGWAGLGFRRPHSWVRIGGIALAAAVLRVVLGDFVIDPLTSRVWPAAIAPAGAEAIPGHVGAALVALLVVWGFAAFGEEIAYRGYLLGRLADALGRSRAAYWVAVVATAILFGFGHYYKGPAGILDSGVAGLVLGAAYMLAGNNIWASILAHGFIDTYAVAATFLGQSP
jgi:hypothetical protein